MTVQITPENITATLHKNLPTLDGQQIQQLLQLKYVNSSPYDPKSFLCSEISIVNEIINICQVIGFEETVKFLTQVHTPQDVILQQLYKEEVKQRNLLALSRTDQQVSKILGKCTNCGSEALRAVQIQTRGLDEAATTFIVCANCGTRRKK